MHPTHGATLLEALVTLLVIGAIVTMAWSTHKYGVRALLRRDVRTVETFVTQTIIRASHDTSPWRLTFHGRELRAVNHESGESIAHRLSTGSIIQHPASLSLYTSGVVSPASFTIAAAGIRCRIIVSLLGRVRSTC